ncbi:MAG TPA: hypothetical protein PKM63_19490 [Panacibacter sp.]|nr:hypothetical protein [Panacibacter sp.]HNP46488.1 hypothetical protein [Panacibacter sp.]
MKDCRQYTMKAIAFQAICLCLFLDAKAQDVAGIDPKNAGTWIERNWVIAVIIGVVLLLFMIPSGSRRTTRSIRKDNGIKTEITTTEEE